MKFGGSLLCEYFLQGGNLGLGVDTEQALFQGINLHLTNGLGGGHQLPIDIGDAHAVGVDNRQLAYATAHQTLGAPRTYAAYAKDNHAFLGDAVHRLATQQQLTSTKYCTIYCHRSYFGLQNYCFFSK
jgi:hypothetical protein